VRLGFLVTTRCNAACSHCTTSCGPTQTQALTTDTVRRLMDEAVALGRGEPPEFFISGGEPFLDFAQLREVVAHGARLGGRVSCVTNAYWASAARADAMLSALRDAGLQTLAVSTSRYHQQYVRLERVQRALVTAHAKGMGTALKYAVTVSDRAQGEAFGKWMASAGVDLIEVFPVLSYVRDGFALPRRQLVRKHRLPTGACPAAVVTVREDGAAYTCCMPGAFTPLLRLGNVHHDSLEEIDARFHYQGVQRLLHARGPAHFARAAIAAGHGRRLRDGYASVCDLCAHIASDPVLAGVAAATAERFERAELRAVFRDLMDGAPA